MKLLRMLSGTTHELFEGIPDVIEVSNADYDAYINARMAEPLCTDNPTVAAAGMAEAATRLDVELTTDDSDLAEFLKTYGAVVRVKKPKK